MESLVSVRKKTFEEDAKFKPVTIRDSRFGLRKIFLTTNEVPTIGTYTNPGKGPNGEHQN
jgi:hypothetical protein